MIVEGQVLLVRTPTTRQSHIRFPLSALLGDSGNVRILRLLLSYGGPLSAVQIARETGLTRQAVYLVLERLVAQGAARALGSPRSRLYEAVETEPLLASLKPVFEQEHARWEALQTALRDALTTHVEVRSAWLYGSVARGEDTPESDLDLAIVLSNRGREDELRDELDSIGSRFGVDISLVALTRAEVVQRAENGDSWWAGLEQDARVLKGLSPARELSRARGSRKRRT
jgi:predicted nucleotidyltransferase